MATGTPKNPISLLATKNKNGYHARRELRDKFVDATACSLFRIRSVSSMRAPYIDLLPLLQFNVSEDTVNTLVTRICNKLSRVRGCNRSPKYWQCDCPLLCEYCLSAFRYRLLNKIDELRDQNYKLYFRRHVISLPRGILVQHDSHDAIYLLHNYLNSLALYRTPLETFQHIAESPSELNNPIHSNDMFSLYSAVFEGTSMYNPRVDQVLSRDEVYRRSVAIGRLILKGGGRSGQRHVLWNGDHFIHSILNTLEMERRAISLSKADGTASRITFYPDLTTNLMCLELQSLILSHDKPEVVLPDGLLYFGPTQAPRRIRLNEASDMYATSSVSLETKTMRTGRYSMHKQLEKLFTYNGTQNNLTPLEFFIYALGMDRLRTISTSGILR